MTKELDFLWNFDRSSTIPCHERARTRDSPLRSKISSYKPKISPLRPSISLVKPKINHFSPKNSCLRPKIWPFGSLFSPLICPHPWSHYCAPINLISPSMCLLGTSGNSPLCLTGHRPFGAAALLTLHFFSLSLQAGHRVPLTMCDPWMTSLIINQPF